MATTTLNPYLLIGTQHTNGLDAVIAALPVAPTETDLVNAVYGFIQPLYFPTTGGAPVPTFTEVEIKSVVAHAINGYNNSYLYSAATWYNAKQ